MVGIEVFNDRRDYGDAYSHALDKGWHLGAIGAEDLGHKRTDDWGGPGWAKTVVLSLGRSEEAIKGAMRARRFYAIRTPGVRLTYTVDGRPMGSRMSPTEGDMLDVRATVNDPTAKLELVTSFGQVVATGDGKLSVQHAASPSERWYFVRATRGGEPVAYSSPVWVTTRPTAGARSRRVACGRSARAHMLLARRLLPAERQQHRAGRVLHPRHVSRRTFPGGERARPRLPRDHRPQRPALGVDPDFGAYGVVGIPGYENSLHGHAQMLRAVRIYDNGDASAQAVNAVADALRAAGGVFQINHPSGDIEQRFDTCSDTGVLDWEYGYDVRPDTIEVWNVTQLDPVRGGLLGMLARARRAHRRDRRQRLALAVDRGRAGRRQSDHLGVRP